MAYEKQTWDTTSYVTPTRMNHIEDGIEGVTQKRLDVVTRNTNETWASLIGRARDALFNNKSRYQTLGLTIDEVSNLIFYPSRFASTSIMQYFGVRGTSGGIVFYVISTSSTAGTLRKYVMNANGITITDMSSSVAESDIYLYGLDN